MSFGTNRNPEGVVTRHVGLKLIATPSGLRQSLTHFYPRVVRAQPWLKFANTFGVKLANVSES
jgi:hypothetical protein